ncbi:MAG: hypothetical protein N2Z22_09565 [Turneriella sp.]|nr:hypothetical protein [Leptospiraceae bacterium]MCX7633564.1 hypothetical protein [Turneriella sp.]
MELVSSIILIAFTAALILLCNYYRRLLTDGRREYPREELIYVHNFVLAEWQRIVSIHPATGYAGAILGALLGYMLSYTGGIYGEHYESAFFHSAIIPALWLLGQPYLKEKAEELNWPDFIKKFIANDATFFFSLSATLAAQMLVAYGFYHALSFLWIFFNYATTVGLVLYHLRKSESGERGGVPERPGRST